MEYPLPHRERDTDRTQAVLPQQIPLCDIKAVRRRPYPVWHGWRGDRDDALGTNAIEIELAERQVLVSPRDEGGFLAALGRPIEHANADG